MTRPVASFDVFDTLLTREWAEPVDLFVRLGESLRSAGMSPLDPARFALRRIAAEQRAGRGPGGPDITLHKIIRELGVEMRWDDAAVARAVETELNLEAAAIRPVPALLPLVAGARARGAQVVFLSDMYLPTAAVRSWLTRAGFHHAGDLLLVSGDAGANKGSGRLFVMARDQLGADFSAWTHYGDNPGSDDLAPQRLGIATAPQTIARLTAREKILRGSGRVAAPERSRMAGVARLARLACPPAITLPPQRVLWDTGATVAGPLFWAFTAWCRQEARQRGITDLYFLARGGQIFRRIALELEAGDPGGPRCHYLPVSRLAVAGARTGGDPARIRELAMARANFHSVRQALVRLGVETDPACLPPSWDPAEWDRNLDTSERLALADWLVAPGRLARVQAALAARADAARAYLAQCGLRAEPSTALVDTGWMGSIQHNLEGLLGRDGQPATLTGFYLGLAEKTLTPCRGEMLGYTNLFDPLLLRGETTQLVLLELMARGDHGPVLDYVHTGGAWHARLGPVGTDYLEETNVLQAAILACSRELLAAGVGREAPPQEIARAVIGGYREFVRHPSFAEAGVFGRLAHSDQMLERHHSMLCPPMTWRESLRAIGNHHHRPPGWWLAGQTRLNPSPLLSLYAAWKEAKARWRHRSP